MIWLQELYWGEKARAQGKKLVRAAEGGRTGRKDACWLITLSVYPHGQLDLFKTGDLGSKLFKKEEMVVLGVAKDREEAMNLLEKMASECLEKGGGQSLREYYAAKATTDWRGVRA